MGKLSFKYRKDIHVIAPQGGVCAEKTEICIILLLNIKNRMEDYYGKIVERTKKALVRTSVDIYDIQFYGGQNIY
jgi:hypothetical protein